MSREAYRLIDETLSLIEYVLQQLPRLQCSSRGKEDNILRGPAYNMYTALTRMQDNLIMLRHILSNKVEENGEK